MIIATLQFELIIRHSECLKDKRRVVNSVKERLRRTFKVSVAEVGALDHHRLALLGVAAVSNSSRHGAEIIDKVIQQLREEREAELGDMSRQMISGTPVQVTGDPLDESIPDADVDELLRGGEAAVSEWEQNA